MHIVDVLVVIALFTLVFLAYGKLFASNVSPTVVGTPTTPNAQTEADSAANQAIVPTSTGDEILEKIETDVKDVVEDVKKDL